jgi:hypothetical protein
LASLLFKPSSSNSFSAISALVSAVISNSLSLHPA